MDSRTLHELDMLSLRIRLYPDIVDDIIRDHITQLNLINIDDEAISDDIMLCYYSDNFFKLARPESKTAVDKTMKDICTEQLKR